MTEPSAQGQRVRVLIAEDQTLIREGMTTLLSQQGDDLEMLPGATDGAQAIDYARRYRPDIVLMDLQMPRVDGIAAMRRILREFPETRIIVLTTFETDELIFEAIGAGARAYLLKDARIEDIAATIRAVWRGQSALSPQIVARVLEEVRRLRPRHSPAMPADDFGLTARESDILKLIVDGRSNSWIGRELGLTEGTVKNYVSSILRKYGARNRTDLAIKAVLQLEA